MVPHSWILRSMGLVGVATNITSFMEKAVKMWNTTLTINGETIGEVQIKRGIFQGDSLSPLLFIISLIPLTMTHRAMNKGYKLDDIKVNHLLYMDDLKIYACSDKEMESLVNMIRIFSEDISMEFGFEKCAKVSSNKGKLVATENLKLPSGKEIQELEMTEAYKYLGIQQADSIKNEQTKDITRKEYKNIFRQF